MQIVIVYLNNMLSQEMHLLCDSDRRGIIFSDASVQGEIVQVNTLINVSSADFTAKFHLLARTVAKLTGDHTEFFKATHVRFALQ